MTMANEESEIIFQIVDSSVQLFGIVFGFAAAFVAGLALLPISGILPLLGVFPLLLLLVITGNIAKAYYRKFLAFGAKKLSIVQEICLNFKNIKSLQLDAVLLDQFVSALNRQYRALQWCNVYSTKFSGGVTSAILVGGLYLIWCDTNIKTKSTEVLILLLLFAHHVQRLMLDFCNCIFYILQAAASLDKLKQCYQLSTADNVRLKPSRQDLVIQINDAEVKWPAHDGNKGFMMCLNNFHIVGGQIIGITGNAGGGKTTLLHSILRNTEARSGKILQRGKLAFFPSKPVLINTSLKENILFGEPMDPQRYYLAINAMKLNEDVLQTAGADDIPVPYLELSPQQIDRIVLARAIYCRRQIMLLDEPLNRVTDRQLSKELFLQMLNAFRQNNKTAIIVSRFDEFLQYCDRVFRVEDGAIYREGSYAEILNMPSHIEMTRRCNIETASRGNYELHEGSDPSALNIARNVNCDANRRSKRFSSASLENSETLLAQANQTSRVNIRNFTFCDYFSLTMLHLINNTLYFGPILTLVIIVEQGDIRPWLSSICLAVILLTFLVDSFSKVYIARITSNQNRSYQQSLLKELLSCSLTYLQTTRISDVVDLFTDTISEGFQHIDSCINQALIVIFSITLLIFANFWTSCIVAVLLVIAMTLIYYLRYSLRLMYSHEHLSRRRMNSILTNHLAGRVVTQTFDYIPNFVQEFYDNVEENSTAIFMSKSIRYHAEFWISFAASVLGMIALLLILLLTPQSQLSIHRFILAVFSYLTLAHGLRKFVDSTLLAIVATKKIEVLQGNIAEIQRIEEPPRPAALTQSDIGVSVYFRDIVYRVANRKLLKIPKLHIQAGETVAIVGNGNSLIVPLLFRIFNPNQGSVSLNQLDISELAIGQLKKQIGVIPANPRANGVTIGTFLNPDGSIPSEQINDVLIEIKLFEGVVRLQNKIESDVCKLSLKDRQLLCLARCYLQRPSLLIVEQPSPEINDIISMAVRKKFAEQTVIIVASHESQYRDTCERVIDLNKV